MKQLMWMTGVLAACLGTGHASLAAADDLGRLFYTPTQRAQLENARTRNPTRPVIPRPGAAPDAAPAPLRFDGVMIRSDGKTTHWVDGKPQSDRSGLTGLKPGQIRADGQVYEPYQVLRPAPEDTSKPGMKDSAP